jgi:opacity protein-like surface antigen
MRRVIVGLVGLLGMVQGAAAADLGSYVLRGSDTPTYRWGGLYVGGQVGYSSTGFDFTTGLGSLISLILRNTRINQDVAVSDLSVLGTTNRNGFGFGGFVGYNWQWNDAVLGTELNYSRMNFTGIASGYIGRVLSDPSVSSNYAYDTYVTGHSSIRLTDVATMRLRGGWAVGPFLPYGFVGLAVGRADASTTATVAFCGYDSTDATVPQDPAGCATNGTSGGGTATQAKNGEFIWGGAAGLGVDMSLLPNVFVRAEWEYLLFAPIHNANVSMNSFRTGVGVLF